MLRLGFIGAEYKGARAVLLRNLQGSSAFRDGSKPTNAAVADAKEVSGV